MAAEAKAADRAEKAAAREAAARAAARVAAREAAVREAARAAARVVVVRVAAWVAARGLRRQGRWRRHTISVRESSSANGGVGRHERPRQICLVKEPASDGGDARGQGLLTTDGGWSANRRELGDLAEHFHANLAEACHRVEVDGADLRVLECHVSDFRQARPVA